MTSEIRVNPTTFGIEDDYPQREQLPDELVSWDVSLPDKVPYEPAIVDRWPKLGTVPKKMNAAGLEITHVNELHELARMGTVDVIQSRGEEFAQRLADLRYPFGRTGLNGVGMFYKPGASVTADMIVVHEHEGGIEIPLVLTRNSWNTPGGFAEPGETVEQIALREFREETNHDLEVDGPELIRVLHEVAQSKRSVDHGWLEANVFAVRTDRRFDVSIGEHADDAKDVRWWDTAELPQLVADGLLSKKKLDYITKALELINDQ